MSKYTINPDTGYLDIVGESGGGGTLTNLVGDSGGTVQPNGSDNISLIGDATQAFIETTGTPASNKVEIKLVKPDTDGYLLIGHTANGEPSEATLTAGTGISITNGAGSITINSTSASDLNAVTQSGTAVSAAGVLNFVNGTGISMAGSSNNLTITAGTAVPTLFVTDSGNAAPSGNQLTVSGGTGVNTSGSGSEFVINIDSPVTVANGGTGSTSFTAGSVIFSNGSILTEDNANLFFDNTNNRLGIGMATPLDTLHVSGNMELDHTAIENDGHALDIVCDAAGYSDVKAIDINFITGAIAAGEADEAILINIDESLATGGQIVGMQVLSTTEGTDTVIAMKCGPAIDAIRQEVGTFVNMDSALNKTVDVLAALSSGGAGNITMFVADNDTITIGDAATFGAMEIIIDTPASGSGIAPTFEYSTGVGTWAAFGPADGTNGFRNTGVIEWDVTDLAGFAVGTSSEYLIRITRTRNSLTTSPIVDKIQIAALTEYKWDKNGALSVSSLTLVTPLAVAYGGTGQSSYTDGQLLIGATTGNTLAKATLTAGEGIDITNGTSAITIDCEIATAAASAGAANLGVASFLNDDFGVSSGFTSLNDAVVKSIGSGSGTATPTSHSFSIVGTGGVTTSATGTTVTVDGSGVVATTSAVQLQFVDDFTADLYPNDYWGLTPGSGSEALQVFYAGHPGAARIYRGIKTDTVFQIGNGVTTIQGWVFIEESGFDYAKICRFGLNIVSSAAVGTDAVYFDYSSTTRNDTWDCITRASSSSTTTDSLTVVGSGWNLLKIVINSGASSVEFFINDVSVATHSTNIPSTSSAYALFIGASSSIDRPVFDYVSLVTDLTGDRA